MSKYLTTTEAARICNVTRFTVANWVKEGKLKASRTAGGHRRIPKSILKEFIKKHKIIKIGENHRSYLIPPCWEVKNLNRPQEHNCPGCLVFKIKANRCFLLVKQFGTESIQCQEDCHKCRYLKKYYPEERSTIENMEKEITESIRNEIHKKGSTFSTFFEKSLFTSGKYLGSIKKILSDKYR